MSQKNWAIVTLGDIAENISSRVNVSKWGSTSELSFGMKLESGDVLFCRCMFCMRKCSASHSEQKKLEYRLKSIRMSISSSKIACLNSQITTKSTINMRLEVSK